MTIHDILCNCGSINRYTYLAVATLSSHEIVWQGFFKDLPNKVEYRPISLYLVGWHFCEETNSSQAYFRFYV